MITKVSLGADHGGYELKEEIKTYLKANNIDYIDCGTNNTNAADYPDFAQKACALVQTNEVKAALLFCGTGVGISIAANKLKGIRACCCSDVFSAKHTRLHNDANALCLGGRVIGPGLAIELIDVFLNTSFQGEHHQIRVDKISALEE